MTSVEHDLYDVAVIGGGAAGLSAALVLGRSRRSVLVVNSGNLRNRHAATMHGYLSRDGMPPTELLESGYQELVRYGVQVHQDTVDGVGPGAGRVPGRALRRRLCAGAAHPVQHGRH